MKIETYRMDRPPSRLNTEGDVIVEKFDQPRSNHGPIGSPIKHKKTSYIKKTNNVPIKRRHIFDVQNNRKKLGTFMTEDYSLTTVSTNEKEYDALLKGSILTCLRWLKDNVLKNPTKGYYLKRKLEEHGTGFDEEFNRYLINSVDEWKRSIEGKSSSESSEEQKIDSRQPLENFSSEAEIKSTFKHNFEHNFEPNFINFNISTLGKIPRKNPSNILKCNPGITTGSHNPNPIYGGGGNIENNISCRSSKDNIKALKVKPLSLKRRCHAMPRDHRKVGKITPTNLKIEFDLIVNNKGEFFTRIPHDDHFDLVPLNEVIN